MTVYLHNIHYEERRDSALGIDEQYESIKGRFDPGALSGPASARKNGFSRSTSSPHSTCTFLFLAGICPDDSNQVRRSCLMEIMQPQRRRIDTDQYNRPASGLIHEYCIVLVWARLWDCHGTIQCCTVANTVPLAQRLLEETTTAVSSRSGLYKRGGRCLGIWGQVVRWP